MYIEDTDNNIDDTESRYIDSWTCESFVSEAYDKDSAEEELKLIGCTNPNSFGLNYYRAGCIQHCDDCQYNGDLI